ncbi:hypothetical protein ACIF8T_00480 [Streptomyces sp. NPDC085946]|uniref:hypothetical protein n=1 Tax=Streptomyces sp. NPDC085946 TaxID=3365744 RepID=UPI0037D4ABE5
MGSPVCEEFDPASDCDCPGRVHRRRVLPYYRAGRGAGHPAAHRVRAVTAAATAAPRRSDVPAGDEPGTAQGGPAPLHGPGGRPARPAGPPAAPAITRTEIIERATARVAAEVPYRLSGHWSDGYRQDCSGYAPMAWKLPGNEWTGSLARYADRISEAEIRAGDILLFHNAADPRNDSRVVVFGGWTDRTRSSRTAYERTRPHTRRQTVPRAWGSGSAYVPHRYKGIVPDPARPATTPPAPYPGAASRGHGPHHGHVARPGRVLVARGAGRFHASGPGPRRTDADRRGAAADGLPGPPARLLPVTDRGGDGTAPAAAPPASHGVHGCPGRAVFRPGADTPYVTRLGKHLVRKGFGTHCTTGPGPRRGGAADGHPGPETWRRLFS